MKQQACSNSRNLCKIPVSGQQTRRSMISREENPAAIHEPNIQDILALELSDTLINAAYNLSVTSITVGIQKICDSLQKMFLLNKSFAFENMKIYSNRANIHFQSSKQKSLRNQLIQLKSSLFTQIDLLQQSRLDQNKNNNLILLTKEQQIEKVYNTVLKRLDRMCKILSQKLTKNKYYALTKLQTYDPNKHRSPQSGKYDIQQTFQKYKESRMKGRHFHRRSIDKKPSRKSFNQLTYSLNKNHDQTSRIKSPQKNNKSRNLLFTYSKQVDNHVRNDKKASTCSHTQSNHSNKQSEHHSGEYYTSGRMTPQSNPLLSRLKISSPSNNFNFNNNKMDESRGSSFMLSGSYFAEGTKQRELQILRKKYFRLVEEFKDFSQRFLQVIKEE